MFSIFYVRLRVFHILRQTPCFPYFTSDSVFSIFYVRLRVFHILRQTPCFHILRRTPCFPYDSVFSIFLRRTPCFPYDSVFSIFFSDVRLRVFHVTPCFPYFYDVRLRGSDSGTPTPCFPSNPIKSLQNTSGTKEYQFFNQ